MKAVIILTLILAAVFPLSAQSSRNIVIYVPEVKGYGNSPSDNIFITRMLTEEVEARNYIPVKTPLGAEFHLIGELSTFVDDEDGIPVLRSILHLLLMNVKTDEILVDQELIYTTLDDMHDPFTLLMFNMFSQNLGKEMIDEDSWREKWFFFGGNISWTPRIYYGTRFSGNLVNFGIGINAEYYFHRLFTVETGLKFAPDWVVVSDLPGDFYRDLQLEIPVIFKYIIRPRNNNMLEPCLGLNFNISLFGITIPPPVSLVFGGQYGMKAGQGIFFADVYVSVDLGKSGFSSLPDPYISSYHRTAIYFNAGYKVGVLTKKRPLKYHFDGLLSFLKHKEKGENQ